jgi:uncharacterized coiled-coil DUF342 family protein
MQLEKVTNRSGPAALAGWISSNDVTLFTTVLVLAIAMFLHARLSKGAKANVDLSKENVTLAKKLDATTSARDAFNLQLNETQKTLKLTQAERDKLQKDLLDKLEAITRLNAKLDALLGEKGKLESERNSLVSAKDALTKEKSQLETQQTSLSKDRDSLKTSNSDLLKRLDAISEQLTEKIAALEKLEQERARLKKQADELDAIVSTLKEKLEQQNIKLTQTKARYENLSVDSQSEVQKLKSQLAERDKSAEEYLAKLRRASELFQALKMDNQRLEKQLSQAEFDKQSQLLEEGRNNRELVGLTGKLEKVAVLFDASGSMRMASNNGVTDRWAEAQDMAATWLKHLNVQECVLIVFSSNVRTFPEDGAMADFRGPDGKAKREALLQHVEAITPGGWTDTYSALKKAYEYKVDAILLFSDGAPSVSTGGIFDPNLAKQIYTMCKDHSDIPVHTIGLGNYFDRDASTFLQTVAKITGGTFRGK